MSSAAEVFDDGVVEHTHGMTIAGGEHSHSIREPYTAAATPEEWARRRARIERELELEEAALVPTVRTQQYPFARQFDMRTAWENL